jgi:hypothetical protein
MSARAAAVVPRAPVWAAPSARAAPDPAALPGCRGWEADRILVVAARAEPVAAGMLLSTPG